MPSNLRNPRRKCGCHSRNMVNAAVPGVVRNVFMVFLFIFPAQSWLGIKPWLLRRVPLSSRPTQSDVLFFSYFLSLQTFCTSTTHAVLIALHLYVFGFFYNLSSICPAHDITTEAIFVSRTQRRIAFVKSEHV